MGSDTRNSQVVPPHGGGDTVGEQLQSESVSADLHCRLMPLTAFSSRPKMHTEILPRKRKSGSCNKREHSNEPAANVLDRRDIKRDDDRLFPRDPEIRNPVELLDDVEERQNVLPNVPHNGGKVVGIGAIMRDVTSRFEQMKALRAALKTSDGEKAS